MKLSASRLLLCLALVAEAGGCATKQSGPQAALQADPQIAKSTAVIDNKQSTWSQRRAALLNRAESGTPVIEAYDSKNRFKQGWDPKRDDPTSAWRQVADDYRAALAMMPDDPKTWEALQKVSIYHLGEGRQFVDFGGIYVAEREPSVTVRQSMFRRMYPGPGGVDRDQTSWSAQIRAAELARTGYCRAMSGADLDGMANFDAAIKLAPEVHWAYALRGRYLARWGENDRASADLAKAIERAPQQLDLMVLRAIIDARRADWASERADASAAIALEPNLPIARTLRGEALVNLHKPAPAYDDLTVALNASAKADSGKDPEEKSNSKADTIRLQALTLRAAALVDLHRYDEARGDIAAALAISGRSGDAYLARARLNVAQSRQLDALNDIDLATRFSRRTLPPAIAVCSDLVDQHVVENAARTRRAICYLRNNQADKAAADLQIVLAADPRNARAHYAMGLVYLDRADPKNSAVENGWAISLDPDLSDAQNRKGQMLRRAGEHSGAIAAYTAALRNAIDPAPIYFNRACSYLVLKNARDARNDIEAIVRERGATAETHYMLGLCSAQEGNLNDAISECYGAQLMDRDNAKYAEAVNTLRGQRSQQQATIFVGAVVTSMILNAPRNQEELDQQKIDLDLQMKVINQQMRRAVRGY